MIEDIKRLFWALVVVVAVVFAAFHLWGLSFSKDQIKTFGQVLGALGLLFTIIDATFHRAAEVPLDLVVGEHVDDYEMIDLEKTCDQRRNFLKHRWYASILTSIGVALIGGLAVLEVLPHAWLIIPFSVALLIWVLFLLLQMAAAWFDLQGFRETMTFRIEETRRLRRDLAALGNGDQS